MSDWIEIKEGNPLPELIFCSGRMSDDVLVWTSDGHCEMGFAFQKSKSAEIEFTPDNATHWMPTPKGPETLDSEDETENLIDLALEMEAEA